MTEKFSCVLGTAKPVIAMVHFGALPGSPLVALFRERHDFKLGDTVNLRSTRFTFSFEDGANDLATA
jgi:hypothetical protein